jgi:predicted enzyme related to lactoylglutathione lyase
MTTPKLGLIVIRVANLEQTVNFYRALGLGFSEEQHGNGPVHYACNLGGTVVEIYPGKSGTAPDRRNGGATLLGFQVDSLEVTLKAIAEIGATVLTAPQDSPWGKRAVVQDPDGRAIELSERPPQ